MPAHRKRADLRQDNRPERKTLEVVVPNDGDVEVPAPSRKWLKATKVQWVEFWSSGISAAVEDADRAVVQRLFDMRDLQARARVRYEKMPYVEGSQGQPRANPAMADMLALEKSIVALEDRLGLSPKARAQLGLTFGQASLTAETLNKMQIESGETIRDGDEVVDAELLDEWGEA